jgi:hypothetical protein
MSEPTPLARDPDQAAWAFASDPVTFLNNSHDAMHDIERTALDALQLRALQLRFGALRDAIPMLQRLADRQDIVRLEAIEDVVPLLFEHTMFKSYPPALLDKGRFKDLTTWLNKLTAVDLSGVDVSACQSLDDWIAVLDRESPLKICHSSGTSGAMSFLPSSDADWDRVARAALVTCQPYGRAQSVRSEFNIIFPFFRSGASSHLRINDALARHLAGGDPNRVLSAYPGKMSSDVLYLSAHIRAAQARGDLDRLQISPALLARKQEFEALEAEMPAHMDRFFDEATHRLRGKQVFVGGTWNLLHGIATKGLARGEEAIFAPDSVVNTGGGAKGMTPPENWESDVCRFFGVERLTLQYGMSEIAGLHPMCSEGHYHFVPWVIPIVLDPETSKPLPRTGVTTGRAAFFDLGAETRWGGFISGDEVTVHWDDQCPCGRKSARIVGGIQRYSEKNGGDDKITCAATEGAHKEAMSFLNNFE